MPDLDDLQDRFEALRRTAGRAQLAEPDTVRAHGEARTRRNRLVGTALAVAVVVGGTGSVLALSRVRTETLRPTPPAVAPSATDSPSPATTLPSTPGTASAPAASTPVPARRPATPTPVRPAATPRTAAPTTPLPVALTPALTVDLVLTSAPGDPAVRYRATVSGLVSQLWASGPGRSTPLPGPDQLLNTRVDLGNGTTDGSDGGAVSCHAGAALVPTSGTFTEPTLSDGSGPVYAPGTYTITFRASYCGDKATVLTAQQGVTFTIPAPSPTGTTASATPAH